MDMFDRIIWSAFFVYCVIMGDRALKKENISGVLFHFGFILNVTLMYILNILAK